MGTSRRLLWRSPRSHWCPSGPPGSRPPLTSRGRRCGSMAASAGPASEKTESSRWGSSARRPRRAGPITEAPMGDTLRPLDALARSLGQTQRRGQIRCGRVRGPKAHLRSFTQSDREHDWTSPVLRLARHASLWTVAIATAKPQFSAATPEPQPPRNRRPHGPTRTGHARVDGGRRSGANCGATASQSALTPSREESSSMKNPIGPF